MRFEDGYGAPEKRYSPECVEGAFYEVRMQHRAYPPQWTGGMPLLPMPTVQPCYRSQRRWIGMQNRSYARVELCGQRRQSVHWASPVKVRHRK
jgi:hypothetical protein